MDEELYQAFITESEESITQLNNSLLELESNPEDTDAIDEIFRQAHTLKGNFGAMGFDNAATVAHAVEDLLDEIRHDRLEVTPERMDLVFDGMDEILDILHEIEEHGESRTDPTDLVEKIRAAAEGDDDAETTAGNSDAAAVDESAAETDVAALTRDVLDEGTVADADHLYHVAVELDTGEMKGVDAGLFLGNVPEEFDVVGASPDVDSIERGDFEDGFALFVAGVPGEELDATLSGLWKVESVECTDASDAFDAPVAGDADAGTDAEAETESEADAAESAAGDDSTESDDADERSASGDGTDADDAEGVVADPSAEVDPEEAEAAVEAVASFSGSGGTSDDASEADADADAPESDAVEADADATADAEAESDEEPAETPGEPASADAGGDASEASSADDDASESSESEKKDEKKKKKGRSISAVKSVRVDVDQLDQLHELVEQLVTSRIKLRQAMEGEGAGGEAGLDTLDELDKISTNLQNTVMDMRLIPLKKVFDKFPRMVRDIAREQDKRVRFKVEGEDIELDRTILDEISDPLMHVLRNAVDHGIEMPDEREAAGKSRTGTIELSARRQHDTVIVTVEDDGGGIDADAVRDKAVSKGLATREEINELPDEEVYDYVFHPGFSTNDEITDVSGRGVGMDVVKTTVESLDGSVDVTSTPGEGSTFTIRLPVSVAIIKVLFVSVGEREFGVPIKYIDEISRRQRVETINAAEVVVHEDQIFPLIRLRNALDVDIDESDSGMVVRIRPEDRQVALHCDSVTRQEEVVVTPLQGPLSGTRGLSGTAVIGDGNVIPILDVSTLELPEQGKQAMREWTPPSTEDEGATDAEEAAD
ncbi:chemotaxis protein CheA [Halopelagius longus]|uniref:Chemotaxis protein CheA n=1 Tax=Halopelagius longus TaxID=1236180 RepID=A0A1H1BDW8_9EURY|nr:chemotaxis protein CheA [Halopelagius longus]RDI70750.1 chemotaxis protein CheA [Halopelagius longus]SDQ50092.1 two-component system, chemotaxis family, sensor kinase CheA [Halopelagius longus]